MIEQNPVLMAVNRLLSTINFQAANAVYPYLERLFQAMEEGHTFIELTEDESKHLLVYDDLVSDGKSYTPIVVYHERLFLNRYFDLEKQLAIEINRLSNHQPKLPKHHIADKLYQWFTDEKSVDQQAAVALALLKNFVLISGGPGTGKTTTVAKLLAILCIDELPTIYLAAPTGKAAARMKEALNNAVAHISDLDETVKQHLLNLDSQTVHRMLGLRPPQMLPRYTSENPLAADVVLLDEASMLDSYLLLQILQALPSHCRVILLGDTDQLPSVGMGAVLATLTADKPLDQNSIATLKQWLPENPLSHLFARYARLTISHRFDKNSAIGQLATAVLNCPNQIEQVFQLFTPDLSTEQHSIHVLVNKLYQHHKTYWQAIEQNDVQTAFIALNSIVVLTALRVDAEKINKAYVRLLQEKGKARGDKIWFSGQALMITSNDHTQKLYNGDIGIVMLENEQALVYFPESNGFRKVALNRISDYDIAFALTVHKSQGSEYQEVWLYSPEQESNLFNRALLYTAITRAKQKFIYFGLLNTFQAACNNIESRQTALAEFLDRHDVV